MPAARVGRVRRLRRTLIALLIGVAAVAVGAPIATAVTPAPTGYDVAYPLCGAALPTGAAFAVVGVNGGLANNPNPCLAAELTWAAATPGLASASQPPASLYLNTADPGNRVPDWPSPAFGAAFGATPYGACDGSWSPACAYLYGAARAAASYQLVVAANTGVAPAATPWWLDVEQVNTWAKPADLPGFAAVNVAAIKGFAAGLRSAGAVGPIGLYSTTLQWQAITGLSQFGQSFPDWYAGLGALAAAESHCQTSFSGGRVELAQFAVAGLDGDVACPTPVGPGLRITAHALRRGALTAGGAVAPTYAGRVTVALAGLDGNRAITVTRHPLAAAGRWRAVLPLPVHGRLHGGRLTVSTGPAFGLLAATAHLRVRLAA